MTPKQQIRRAALVNRRGLTVDEAHTRSMRVHGRVLSLPAFDEAPLVLAYVSAKDNEVDTRGIISDLLENGRRVACPKPTADGRLEWREILSVDDLVQGAYGIPEPLAGCDITIPDAATVALVPGIAFDAAGNRIGYGGGYFDRFLADFPGTSIGLAFDFQVLEPLPVEAHDIPLHFVVAESKTYDNHKK